MKLRFAVGLVLLGAACTKPAVPTGDGGSMGARDSGTVRVPDGGGGTVSDGGGPVSGVDGGGPVGGVDGGGGIGADGGACQPSCSAKLCGDDGCGSSCGSCSATETCSGAGSCVAICRNADGVSALDLNLHRVRGRVTLDGEGFCGSISVRRATWAADGGSPAPNGYGLGTLNTCGDAGHSELDVLVPSGLWRIEACTERECFMGPWRTVNSDTSLDIDFSTVHVRGTFSFSKGQPLCPGYPDLSATKIDDAFPSATLRLCNGSVPVSSFDFRLAKGRYQFSYSQNINGSAVAGFVTIATVDATSDQELTLSLDATPTTLTFDSSDHKTPCPELRFLRLVDPNGHQLSASLDCAPDAGWPMTVTPSLPPGQYSVGGYVGNCGSRIACPATGPDSDSTFGTLDVGVTAVSKTYTVPTLGRATISGTLAVNGGSTCPDNASLIIERSGTRLVAIVDTCLGGIPVTSFSGLSLGAGRYGAYLDYPRKCGTTLPCNRVYLNDVDIERDMSLSLVATTGVISGRLTVNGRADCEGLQAFEWFSANGARQEQSFQCTDAGVELGPRPIQLRTGSERLVSHLSTSCESTRWPCGYAWFVGNPSVLINQTPTPGTRIDADLKTLPLQLTATTIDAGTWTCDAEFARLNWTRTDRPGLSDAISFECRDLSRRAVMMEGDYRVSYESNADPYLLRCGINGHLPCGSLEVAASAPFRRFADGGVLMQNIVIPSRRLSVPITSRGGLFGSDCSGVWNVMGRQKPSSRWLRVGTFDCATRTSTINAFLVPGAWELSMSTRDYFPTCPSGNPCGVNDEIALGCVEIR